MGQPHIEKRRKKGVDQLQCIRGVGDLQRSIERRSRPSAARGRLETASLALDPCMCVCVRKKTKSLARKRKSRA